MDINKYDYKRFEQLLEEMIKEEVKSDAPSFRFKECVDGRYEIQLKKTALLEKTLELIKERQTLKDTHASTSTEDGRTKTKPE